MTVAAAKTAILADPAARVRLLGGAVDAITPDALMDFVAASIGRGRRAIIANHNLHSLYLVRRDPEMAAFYALADRVQADSTPMIAWGRLLGRPIQRAHRATYLDWRESFWRRAVENRWRVFYLGGAPGVAERGAEAIRARWPGAIVEARDGYFDMDDPVQAQDARAAIADWRPDVLLVGMGMPRQERWIARNHRSLPPCVTFTIGAAFDYEAGVVPTAPRWTGRVGVEWLYRFVTEPRRLFSRYFIEPWSLIGPALSDLSGR
jgi:N-acetylglucosaminyldiphosphoundecaprenol N-acetyl-beta-D-mannosaminyltransferase